mgnify:FL=1
MKKKYKITIDRAAIDKYSEHYFEEHPRAYVPPIKQPYHESINKWMIMRRPAMNALKQKWKGFITWYVEILGYSALRIQKYEIIQTIYYPTKARRDPDNSTPKFILDGLVEGGMLGDDDGVSMQSLTLKCRYDKDNPRTEIEIKILE